LYLRISKVVLEGGVLVFEIAEMGKELVFEPALGVETETGQQVRGMAGMLADIGQGLVFLAELQHPVGLLGLAQQHGADRLL